VIAPENISGNQIRGGVLNATDQKQIQFSQKTPGSDPALSPGHLRSLSPEMVLMIRRLRETERLQQKFHALETRILSILNLQDFFEILLTEMGRIFSVPFVWLSVIKKSMLADLINPLIESRIIIERTRFLDKREFDRIFYGKAIPPCFLAGIFPGARFFCRDRTIYRAPWPSLPCGSMERSSAV
jgi:hypothetical protein